MYTRRTHTLTTKVRSLRPLVHPSTSQSRVRDGNDPPTDAQNIANLGNDGNAEELIALSYGLSVGVGVIAELPAVVTAALETPEGEQFAMGFAQGMYDGVTSNYTVGPPPSVPGQIGYWTGVAFGTFLNSPENPDPGGPPRMGNLP
jgi:hypothetical protein